MNSAVKPLAPSPQSSAAGNQVNKAMHPQGTATSFNQPAHVPQSLVNIHTNTNAAHNHPSAPQHHYPLTVPNTSGHYLNQSMGQIPASNHPVANPSSTAAGQGFSPQKNVPYLGSFQANLAHQASQNTFPPISQTLPASVAQQQHNVNPQHADVQLDKPHSNGTPEVKSPQKMENQSSLPSPAKEKVAPPTPAPVPQLSQVQEKTAPIQAQLPQKPPETSEPKALTPASISVKPSLSSPATQTAELPVATALTVNDKPAASAANKDPKPSDTEVKKVEVVDKSPAPQSEYVDKSSSLEKNKEAKAEDEHSKSAEPAPSAEEKPQEQTATKNEQPPTKQTPTVSTAAKTPVRKPKAPPPKAESPKTPKEPKIPMQKSPATGKAKRHRIRTQPYQSPLPEVELISKITSATSRNATSRNNDEKLIVFYKNEFLAVRNAEGSFYLCQAVQNIYKTSSKIKIRWLSQDKNDKSGEIYTPDFYDLTDFDCILTNLSLSRIEKGKFKLPPSEKERTESILNRSLAVEKGEVTSPSLTEEHPDGLDLSLYKDEDQLKKRRAKKRKPGRKPSKSPAKKEIPTRKSPETPKARRVAPPPPTKAITRKIIAAKKTAAAKKVMPQPQPEPKRSAPSTSRSTGRGKRKMDVKPSSPVLDQKKVKVLARIGRKSGLTVAKTGLSNVRSAKTTIKVVASASSSKKTVQKKSSTAVKAPPTRITKRSTRK